MTLPLALLLLLAAAGPPRVLFDGELVVPRARARGIPVKIERPTYVACQYGTKSTSGQIRVALMTAADVHAYQEGQPHEMLTATDFGARGEFRLLVMRPGEYFVLVDNRVDTQPSQTVAARVTVVEDPTLPHTLPPARRQAVVGISLTLFTALAAWSGWRLRGARLFS